MSNFRRRPGPGPPRVKFSATVGPHSVNMSNSRPPPGPHICQYVKLSAFPGPPLCQILGVLGPSCQIFGGLRAPRVKFTKKRSSLLSFDGRPTTSCQIFGGLRPPPCQIPQKKGRHFYRLTTGRQPYVKFSHRGTTYVKVSKYVKF